MSRGKDRQGSGRGVWCSVLITFKPLASSSAGCSYLLSSGDNSLLLDCGLSFEQIQRGLDYKVTQLDGCLITHGHGDHVKGFKGLLAAGVNCYATLETWDHLKAHRTHRSKIITPYKEFRVGDWQVVAVDCVHDFQGTVGYVIKGGGATCLYLSDTAWSRNKFPGLTHLFIECNHSVEIMRDNTLRGGMDARRYSRTRTNHMSLETLEKFLDANDLSSLQEIHLLHLSDGNSDERMFKERIAAKTGVPVYIAGKHEVPF